MHVDSQLPADAFAQNVLIGVLHNPAQLEVNRTHRFYHLPARLLIGDPGSVAYVAVYQSKRHFGPAKAGIRHWAQVDGVREVPRGEITGLPTRNHTERYYRFDTGVWQTLDPPIGPKGPAPTLQMRTSLFLLKRSKHLAELYIADESQYRLYRCLRQAAARSGKTGEPVVLSSRDGFRVLVWEQTVGIYSAGGAYLQRHLGDFFRAPAPFLQEMHKYVQISKMDPVDFSI